MRAALQLYEHPELSYSEVWAKDAYNRSGTTRMLATVGVFSVVTITALAGVQFSGIVDLGAIQIPHLLQPSILS